MADLHVSKQTIVKLLSDMQGKKFIIPEYQRPYKWEREKCETLWNDIVNFFENDSIDTDYFLGTIVTAENEQKLPEVIDGQQRITSFFLLLRAFYKKLEGMPDDDDVIGLKMQVGPCIWDVHSISKRVLDYSLIHIHSDVATESDNETFHEILRTGEIDPLKKDRYTINYSFFLEACDEYAKLKPTKWYDLCVAILNRCIILPIECNSQETALTIFSTLNDRGLPLTDSDIFKAQIYKHKAGDVARKKFNEDWRYLSEVCEDIDLKIDDIFRYYSHVLRASKGDRSKEVGLRKYYSNNSYATLKTEGVVNDLISLADFWWYIVNYENPKDFPDVGDNYEFTDNTFKYIDVLSFYPNEYWKYAVSVFFHCNHTSPSFNFDFDNFLKKLSAFLLAKFIENPSVNAIKDDIYDICILIYRKDEIDFDYQFNESEIKQRLPIFSSSRITRSLLLLHAYLHPNQKTFIHNKVHIEHILPKRWQNANYGGWNDEEARSFIEFFGNKIVFENKLNIQAGNGYFGRKKEKYKSSKIALVRDLSEIETNDWLKDHIIKREMEFQNEIMSFFKSSLSFKS